MNAIPFMRSIQFNSSIAACFSLITGSPYLPVPKRWAESQPDLLRRLQIDHKLELRQSFYNVACLLVNPPRHRGGVDGAGYFPKCHLFRETAIVRSSAIEEAIPRPPLDATCQTDARSGL